MPHEATDRKQVGCRLYRSECENAYLDLFYRAFTRYGLPLEIYVDRASFFKGEDGNLTQLGRRLRLYGVSFVFANTPEAKGKIERVHQVWQDRLPAYAAREGVTGDTPLEDVNGHLDCLVDYRNAYEEHRELRMSALEAWDREIAEGRCKLRPTPRDGWWELVWAEWSRAAVGPRGRLLVDGVQCPTGCANGTRVRVCRHVDGSISLVLNKPDLSTTPQVVFTTNPRVKRG